MQFRFLFTLSLLTLLCGPVPGQQQTDDAESPAEERAGATGEGTAAEADETAGGTSDAASDDESGNGEDDGESGRDDSDLDEQVYEQDEDDFIPSEEIPADEAIPFPTNI